MSWPARRRATNAVAAAVGEAPGLTTGQLRALLRRAVLALDPDAAQKRRALGERQARVEVWAEPSGTAALAGRDLPPAAVIAADKRITSLALALKAAGVDGTMDQLRAEAFTSLLSGQPAPGSAAAGPASPGDPPFARNSESGHGITPAGGDPRATDRNPARSSSGAARATGEGGPAGPARDARSGRAAGHGAPDVAPGHLAGPGGQPGRGGRVWPAGRAGRPRAGRDPGGASGHSLVRDDDGPGRPSGGARLHKEAAAARRSARWRAAG